MQRKYFLYDPAGDGFQTFSAKEQRDAAAQKAIADCLQDGYWTDDVLGITVGEITGVAGKANVTTRPDNLDENNVGEDGDYWDDDMEEKYDVEIQSIADTSAPQAELATLREKLAAAEASLAELRAKLDVIRFFEQHKTQDDAMQAVTQCVDAVIAKLDLAEAPAPCTWTPDDDGNYATGCDGLFVILEGTPAENKMAYCCYCGKPIQEQPK